MNSRNRLTFLFRTGRSVWKNKPFEMLQLIFFLHKTMFISLLKIKILNSIPSCKKLDIVSDWLKRLEDQTQPILTFLGRKWYNLYFFFVGNAKRKMVPLRIYQMYTFNQIKNDKLETQAKAQEF